MSSNAKQKFAIGTFFCWRRVCVFDCCARSRQQIDQNRCWAHKPIKSNQRHSKREREKREKRTLNTKMKMLIYGEMWIMWLDADNVPLCLEIFMLAKLGGIYRLWYGGQSQKCVLSTHAARGAHVHTFFTLFISLHACLSQKMCSRSHSKHSKWN